MCSEKMKCFCVVVIQNKLELTHKMYLKSQVGKGNRQASDYLMDKI